jgi:hypothetical protein
MKIFQLATVARARVWFGGAVPEFSPSGSLRTAAGGDPNARVARSRLTVEAIVPRGARVEYGLLGMRFDRATDTVLQVEIPYSDGAGKPWSESLAAEIDDVALGLPREYAQPILDVVIRRAAQRFPPGAIRVVEAAHGAVGSSARFFVGLATCGLKLMQDEPRGDEQMVALLKTHLVDLEA